MPKTGDVSRPANADERRDLAKRKKLRQRAIDLYEHSREFGEGDIYAGTERQDVFGDSPSQRQRRLRKLVVETEARIIRETSPRSEDADKAGVQKYALGGDVRYNPNRGKTY